VVLFSRSEKKSDYSGLHRISEFHLPSRNLSCESELASNRMGLFLKHVLTRFLSSCMQISFFEPHAGFRSTDDKRKSCYYWEALSIRSYLRHYDVCQRCSICHSCHTSIVVRFTRHGHCV